MADAPLTFTPEHFAAQRDDLQRRLDAGDYGDDDDGLMSYLIALLDFAASTLRRLSAVESMCKQRVDNDVNDRQYRAALRDVLDLLQPR